MSCTSTWRACATYFSKKTPSSAEIAHGETAYAIKGRAQSGLILAALHADAPTARSALEHDGIADALGCGGCRLDVRQGERCRVAAQSIFPQRAARAVCLSANARICAGVGPTKAIPARSHSSANWAFSLKKAVTRVDRRRARLACRHRGCDHCADTSRRGPRPPINTASSGISDVKAAAVCLGVDRDRSNTEPVQRALNTAGDGAAVGDQDLVETSRRPRARAGSSRRGIPGPAGRPRGPDGMFSPPPRSKSVSVWGCRHCRDC